MRAMLVAAGFGTRLDPLTRELPKPALPVGNRPIAWYACDHLARSGFTELVVNTHHLAGELRAALEPHAPAGVQLRFVHESQILGTGGGVKNAWQPQADEDFVVFNAKLLFAPDLARALDVHRQSGAIATMVLRRLPADATFTGIEVAADGRVLRIGGKPRVGQGTEGSRAEWMYTGVQVLSARAWPDLPAAGDIIAESYWPWLARGERIWSVIDDGPWMDVGVTLRHYLDANLALASGTLRWPGIVPGPNATIIAPSAQVSPSAALEDTVVGPRAQVTALASLQRVVVWPDAHVADALTDAIVTTAGNVVPAIAAASRLG